MMSKMRWAAWVVSVLLVVPLGCQTTLTNQCIPGESKACTGPDGCSGYQVCAESAEAFGQCVCGAGTTSSNTGSGGSNPTTSSAGGSTPTTNSTSGSGGDTSSSGSTSSTGAGGSKPFSPTDLNGLSLWLDDDKGITTDPQNAGVVIHWADSSGKGNQANSNQTSGQFVETLDPGALNGHDAVRCLSSNGLQIADSTSLEFGTGDYAIAMVFKSGSSDSGVLQTLWSRNDSAGALLGVEPNSDVRFFQGPTDAVAVAEVDPTKFHFAIARGPLLRLDADTGSSVGPTASGDVSLPGEPTYLAFPGQTGIEIAEVIAVKGEVSDAEVAGLKGYFKTKFGIGQ